MLQHIDKHEFDPRQHIDYEAGADPELRGSECISCHKLYTWASGMYNRNSAMKYGYDLQCIDCQKAPVLSMEEHVAKLTEENFNSQFTRRQRHEDQGEFRTDRRGRTMDCSLFLQKLLHICPNLVVQQGGLVGDLALYVTSGVARPEWNGQSFRYLGYVHLGTMPEFSSYEFDEERDVLVRVKEIGWRSVLLRFIESDILTEARINQEFGPPSGGVNSVWYKRLHRLRNAVAIQ